MVRRRLVLTGIAAAAVMGVTKPATAQPAAAVSPGEFFDWAMTDPGLQAAQPDENWAWVAAYYINSFVTGYEAYGDVSWLDYAVRYYDLLLARRQPAPDGYLGWIGPYIYDGTFWADVHVADAILYAPMLRFSQVVLADKTLRRTYGDQARQYVRWAERDVFDKWDERGTWVEDGPYGAYNYWNHFFEPDRLEAFVVRDDVMWANTSQQFNKQTRMGSAALRLYQLTHKKRYRDIAEKIFAYHKSRLQYHNGSYVWNFREPFGAWDVRDVATGTLASWVAVHPTSNYQDAEVSHVVEAYNAGLVYTKADMARIVSTNLNVMWNGDLAAPDFVNSNAEIWPDGVPHTDRAGTLWGALAQFDPTVRLLLERRYGNANPRDLRQPIGLAYHQNVTSRRPPSFERTDAHGKPRLFDFPFSDSRYLNLATVMPSVVKPGEDAIVACKSLAVGQLRTSLHSANGRRELAVLDERQIQGSTDGRLGIATFQWDGTDGSGHPLGRGDYRIRWTLDGDGYREFPITIQSRH